MIPRDYRWIEHQPRRGRHERLGFGDRCGCDVHDPADLLKPFPAELMTMWPINPIKSKGPEVLEPLTEEEDEEPPLL
ncbi:hypothetical protein F4V90_04140 [Neorhizobium galegae]|nr:hypothetical protein F4V90_04140 [Neorhizobium galegae]